MSAGWSFSLAGRYAVQGAWQASLHPASVLGLIAVSGLGHDGDGRGGFEVVDRRRAGGRPLEALLHIVDLPRIIDSDLRRWRVTSVGKLGRQWSILAFLFLTTWTFRVELELKALDPASWAAIQERIAAYFLANASAERSMLARIAAVSGTTVPWCMIDEQQTATLSREPCSGRR